MNLMVLAKLGLSTAGVLGEMFVIDTFVAKTLAESSTAVKVCGTIAAIGITGVLAAPVAKGVCEAVDSVVNLPENLKACKDAMMAACNKK